MPHIQSQRMNLTYINLLSFENCAKFTDCEDDENTKNFVECWNENDFIRWHQVRNDNCPLSTDAIDLNNCYCSVGRKLTSPMITFSCMLVSFTYGENHDFYTLAKVWNVYVSTWNNWNRTLVELYRKSLFFIWSILKSEDTKSISFTHHIT